MKKITSLLLTLIMCFSLCVMPAMAAEDTQENTEIEVQVFDSNEAYQAYLRVLDDGVAPCVEGEALLTASVVRKNGASDETCQLYINWTGTALISRIRYKEVSVRSTSILFPTTYKTFGNGVSYTSHSDVAKIAGSILIGEMEIPTDVEKVKVTADDFQGYYVSYGEWVSAIEWTGKVDIKDD